MFLPNKHTVRDTAPHKLIVRCLLGDFRLDLTEAGYPGEAEAVTVDVTVLGGWVELLVPQDWEVLADRVDLTARVRFFGHVDSHVNSSEDDDVEDEEAGPSRVVLNVQGWASRMTVTRGHAPGAPLPAPERPASS